MKLAVLRLSIFTSAATNILTATIQMFWPNSTLLWTHWQRPEQTKQFLVMTDEEVDDRLKVVGRAKVSGASMPESC